MNNILRIIISFTLLLVIAISFHCCKKSETRKNQIQQVKIDNDTLSISIDTLSTILSDKILKSVVQLDEYFYAAIETERTNEGSLKKILKMSINSSGVESIDVPDVIQQEILYNLQVENDSLFLAGQGYKKNFFLDKEFKFISAKKKKFRLYEDGKYKVYSECNGEWGGKLIFDSKENNINYEINVSCPFVINNLQGWYYFTIQDMDQNRFYIYRISASSISTSADPELLYESPESFISTSFVLNEQLVHLYSKNDSTYLGVLEGHKLVPKYTFQSMFDAKLNQHENGDQVLNCYFPKTKKSGILLIDNSEMKFSIFR